MSVASRCPARCETAAAARLVCSLSRLVRRLLSRREPPSEARRSRYVTSRALATEHHPGRSVAPPTPSHRRSLASLLRPAAVHMQADRFRLRTASMGKVHLKLGVLVRNFDKFGVEL